MGMNGPRVSVSFSETGRAPANETGVGNLRPVPVRRRHSELECFVLGLIWQAGACSAYRVRRMLADSPSSQWSGSSGAVYPLLRRLERHRLVKARPGATGRRPKREYRLTAAGLRTLRAWIGPPLRNEAAGVSYDPLRSRARFLAALPPRARRSWASGARSALKETARRVKRWHSRYAGDDPFLTLMTVHARRETAARRAWLSDVETALAYAQRRRR